MNKNHPAETKQWEIQEEKDKNRGNKSPERQEM